MRRVRHVSNVTYTDVVIAEFSPLAEPTLKTSLAAMGAAGITAVKAEGKWYAFGWAVAIAESTKDVGAATALLLLAKTDARAQRQLMSENVTMKHAIASACMLGGIEAGREVAEAWLQWIEQGDDDER